MKQIILSLTLGLFAITSFAKSAKSTVELTEARIFAPIKGSNATAGYGLLKNTSKKAMTVEIKAVVPFKAVEMHETIEKDGRMAMQKKDQFVVEAGQTLEMKPGGNHIMLFDANRDVKDGETLNVELLINGKSEKFDFKVIPRVQKNESEHQHH